MNDATLEALKELKIVWEGMNQHLARIEALEAESADVGQAVDTTLGNIDIVTKSIEQLALRMGLLEAQVAEFDGHSHLNPGRWNIEDLEKAVANGDNAPPAPVDDSDDARVGL